MDDRVNRTLDAVGPRLKHLRTQREITLTDLADLADLAEPMFASHRKQRCPNSADPVPGDPHP